MACSLLSAKCISRRARFNFMFSVQILKIQNISNDNDQKGPKADSGSLLNEEKEDVQRMLVKFLRAKESGKDF